MSDYDCPQCDDSHPTATDNDGYELAFCPRRGTVLVEVPEDNQ